MKSIKWCLLMFLSLILFTNCNNDDDNDGSQNEFESTATILGFDMTLCACCGGWIIDINGQDLGKRFSTLPQDSNINLQNETFPLTVQLNWSESNEFCGNGITIESIALIE